MHDDWKGGSCDITVAPFRAYGLVEITTQAQDVVPGLEPLEEHGECGGAGAPKVSYFLIVRGSMEEMHRVESPAVNSLIVTIHPLG